MLLNKGRSIPAIGLLACALLLAVPLPAQVASGTLSGIVTGPSGGIVAQAKISIKNAATGQTSETESNAAGSYSVSNLTPGDYEVTVSAQGFSNKVTQVQVAEGAKQTLDVALTALPGSQAEPSLGDLGFSPEETRGNAQEQARLDKRTHMLKIHQRMGLITTGPLVATVITSLSAKGHRGTPGIPSSGRNLHTALGTATAGLYFTTASFAIFAPKVAGTRTRGPIRVHKALAWVHGTGMVLTPILGAIAYSQLNRGERVHGIAKLHGPVAVVTAAAYGAAMISVSVKF